MGAGKSTVGREVARLTHRPFVDTDEEIEREHGPIPELFERGESDFRRLERETILRKFALAHEPSVFALGGGALANDQTRILVREKAFTIWLQVSAEEAWERVGGSDRPLARREAEFHRLHAERSEMYELVAEAEAGDVEDVLLAALQICVGEGVGDPLHFWNVGGLGDVGLVADERVLELLRWRPKWWRRHGSVHPITSGERAKSIEVVERLWAELPLDRWGTLFALGGGTTTDVGGFVAATYLRGIEWIAIPTTLVGQVDAAIGGKTGIDLVQGKNLAGAFHFPRFVFSDPTVLDTLPEREWTAGMAEVMKTSLLAGRSLWDLPREEMIRACTAYKAGVVLSDPYETEDLRTVLNLGHTFAHALEAGSGYAVSHGEAVALGLLAALRLSGVSTDVVEEVLRPEPVEADLETAWAALERDKKGEGVFVLLEAPGKPVVTNVPEADARRALVELIRK
jgi:shikimate kinase / 3-dehydroquinate synthase